MEIDAAVVEEESGSFDIETVELESPQAGEVLVRVVGAGACHTDMIVRDQLYPTPLPAVLGHEGSGVVEAVGDGVSRVEPGDHVVLSFDYDDCHSCRDGHPAYCESFFEHNFGGQRPEDGASPLSRNGERLSGRFFGQSSFATHAIATERNVVPVDTGDTVPLELLGPLGCGIQTGAGAVINSLDPQAGSSIAIFGAGSVGLSAVMTADLKGGTEIITIDLKENRLETAAEQAVRTLTQRGTVGTVGAPPLGTEASDDVNDLLLNGRSITGIVEGDSNPREFTPDLVDLYRRGKFPFDELVTYYDFDEIEQAVEDSENGETIKPVLQISEP